MTGSAIPPVIFDTCAIRAVTHDWEDALSEWRTMLTYKNRTTFHLGDVALAEVVLALSEDRVDWDDWKKRVKLIDDLLDDKLPVLPGHRELERFRQGNPNDEPGGISFWKAIWDHISKSTSEKDLQKEIVFRGDDGDIYKITNWDKTRASALFDRDRGMWADFFDEEKRKYSGQRPSQDQIFSDHASNLDQAIKKDPPLSVVLDAQLKALARFVYLSLQGMTPYDPRSTKRRGDTFDFSLLQCLSLPAIICTRDERLITHVQLSNIKHADQVMLPKDIIALLAH